MLRPFGYILAVSWVLLCLLGCLSAHGEVFELRAGGRVVGRLLNADESPRQTYQIETLSGGQITLAADQVVKRTALSPREAEYEKHRADAPDTIDGHWRLAEWCRENYLSAQRRVHLHRILQLDPDHKRARAALGYSRIDGQWKTLKEARESRGLLWYKGRYRTPQEIEVIERQQKRKQAKNKWYGLLNRYTGWLEGEKYEQGRQAIAAINDPAAVAALDRSLVKERRRAVKAIYIEALARIDTSEAITSLRICAIEDNDEEVRLLCLDHLKKEKRPDTVAYFVRMLKDKDNVIINRAAVALAYMKDKSAIRPLIDALVTQHKRKVTVGKSGGVGAAFGSGGTGLGVGTSTRTFTATVENQAVLDALVSLTGGVNFGFDVAAWDYWHAEQNKHAPLDARRQD
ncbi:MAG: HEAT repeat domain-containing protein [Pirellulales bacterium]|nr:HEAT repeat domain-containing protein [Pirellulales bacterium]